MQAKDIMTPDVITITPDTGVREIAKIMLDHHISGVPVVDAGGRLVGIVTDGDLYRRTEIGTAKKHGSWLEIFGLDSDLARQYVEAHALTAADVMTTQVFAVAPKTSLQQVAELFERQHIRRVPVVSNETVVGIVSRTNMVQALMLTTPESYDKRLSDQRIRDLVIAEYRRLPWGMPAESNVIVRDGVIHLWGFVPSDVEFTALRVAAQGIPGARGFVDHTHRFFGDNGRRKPSPSRIIVEQPDHEPEPLPDQA